MSIAEEVIWGDKVLEMVLGELDVDANVAVLGEGAEYEGIVPDVEHAVKLDDDPGCATSVFESACKLAVLVS